MIKIDPEEINSFVKVMKEIYSSHTKLAYISNLVDYSEEYKEIEFFQIGTRVLIPKEFFIEGNRFDNSPVAREFATSITLGEISFIANHLTEQAKNDRLPMVELSELNIYELTNNVYDNISSPTNIFIPHEYRKKIVSDWIQDRWAFYKDGKFYINLGGEDVNVHWSSTRSPFNNIVVYNKNNFKLIQKRFEDMSIPKELTNIYYSYEKGERLSLYFAQSNEENQYDFYFRSMIGFDVLDRHSICIFDTSKLNIETK